MNIVEPTCQPDGNNIHILYVEDDAGLARLLQKQLHRQCGFTVEIALDGEKGLYELKNNSYDLAIVDYNLPTLSGLQLLRILRDNGIDTPVVILTGVGNEEIAAEVMRAGAVDYLVKQVGGEHLEMICSVVRRVWSERQDAIKQKQLFARQRLAKTVFDVTKEGIVVTNAERVIQTVNPAFTEITGYSVDEVVGKTPAILRSSRSEGDFYKRMWASINKSGFWEGEIWNRKKSGEEYPEWLVIHAVCDDEGKVDEYVGVFTDITERKAHDDLIWHQANYDVLTNLPNRTLLVDRAEEALQRAERDNASMALMFVDLDRFKFINDHYGHAAGDGLLIEVAGRIKASLRKSDTVIRLSGDEFIVLMPKIQQAADAGYVAEKIIATLSEPYLIENNRTYLSASAGIAVFPVDGDSVEILLSHADKAMYRAKELGRNQFLFFNQEMNEAAEKRSKVELDLQVALNENQLMMYYQPVVNLALNRITHAEALIRWQHPENGLVMPDAFIPIAEESGLIIPLGEWVVNAVAGQMQQWQNSFKGALQVFLNVSPIQMLHANLDKQLLDALGNFDLLEGSIGVEVTENVLIEGPEKIKAELKKIRAMGVRFLLDDFGTGFSSMRYLREMPFDGLKVDRCFISNFDTDAEKAVLVKAMIEMAHNLKLTVVAEGVERQEELALLREYGCDYAQGYLLGRPMPAEKFFEQLQKQL